MRADDIFDMFNGDIHVYDIGIKGRRRHEYPLWVILQLEVLRVRLVNSLV